MPLSEEQRKRRRLGITATDAAAVCGLSPYRSPAEVWLEKRHPHLVPDDTKERPWLHWGILKEPLIADEYARKTNQQLVTSDTLSNQRIPWLLATPDRLIVGKRKALECKTADGRNSYQWGPQLSDVVPTEYLIQVNHSMMVTTYDEWDLAALIGSSDFRIYCFGKTKDMMKSLYEVEKEFYERFVIGKEQPAYDWGDKIRDFILSQNPQAKKFDSDPLDVEETGDKTLREAILELRRVRQEIAAAELTEESKKAIIQSYMGERALLEWEAQQIKIRFGNVKEGIKIKYKDLAIEALTLLPVEMKQKLLAKHSEKRLATRAFRVYDNLTKEGEGDED